MATKLDPQLLAQILAMQNDPRYGGAMDGNRVTRWMAPEGDPLADYQFVNRQQQQYAGPNEEGAWSPGQNYIYRDTKQDGMVDVYDQAGNFLSREKGANPGNELMQTIALMAGGYYGGNALASAYGAPAASSAAGGATGGMANGAFLGEGVASGIPAWDGAALSSALGSGELGTAASYLGQTMNGGTALETLGSAMNGGSTLGTGANAVANGVKTLGGGSTVGGLLGAAAGALDSGDKTQSTNRDPWAPAQDFLKQQIGQGQNLSTQYQQKPFSQAQQTAYGNIGGLLDAINANAGGLVGGFGANASGANQFDRSNPNKKLVGSSFNMGSFAPGLLGFLGSK